MSGVNVCTSANALHVTPQTPRREPYLISHSNGGEESPLRVLHASFSRPYRTRLRQGRSCTMRLRVNARDLELGISTRGILSFDEWVR